MAIGIDELDFDDGFMQSPDNAAQITDVDPEPTEEPVVEPEPDQSNEPDVVTELLKRQGINDPSKIKFEDEDGSIKDTDWNTLSLEEKLNILSNKETTPTQPTFNPDFNDDVVSLAQELKDNNMSVDDFVNYIKQQSINEYTSAQQPVYSVDNLTDDDLFILDLKKRIPDITQEQLDTALTSAKENEDLYKLQVNGIRKEYQQFEEEQNAQNQAIEQEEQQRQYNEFANNIAQSISTLDNVNGLDLELDDDDKYELAQFILGQDASGVSNLGKALNDPETLVKVAWFALKGADAIDGITDYFKNEIANVRESAYKKGLEDAKNKTTKPAPRVVTTKPTTKTKKYVSIDDLD